MRQGSCFSIVTVAKDAKVPHMTWLRLNRPEKLNAISSTMPDDILYAVESAEIDDEVHVIIIECE